MDKAEYQSRLEELNSLVKKEDYEAFTNQAELRSLEGESEENTVSEQIELLKETIQNLF